MASRTAVRSAAPAPRPPAIVPRWFRPLLAALAVIYVVGVFSRASADSDTPWHLASGRFIWQNHRLPVPDPFAYTSDMGALLYAGELQTRHFNLTHEWGMELLYYLVYAGTGYAGLVLFRSLLLALFCAMTGWLAWRRSQSFYRALAAGIVAQRLAVPFSADRAFLITFVLVTVTVAVYETRRGRWWLPLLFLIWANCHAGFIMGWAVAGIYSAEALFLRLRGKPLADERTIWTVSALSVLASGVNPNGFGVIEVLRYYRLSPMQASLLEWQAPHWWPPSWFSLLMVSTALVLLWARRRVRPADWLLFAAFGGASALATRNTIFIGFIAPVLLATYIPLWKRTEPALLQYTAAALLLLGIVSGFALHAMFQLRQAEWIYPKEAADFLLAHHVTGRMFNKYEEGGYLMWRLWPQEKVFIDGRALNDSVWWDYMHMAYNADFNGKTTQDLLRKYGVEVIVMNGFDHNGQLLFLAAALADPNQKDWKLVYEDAKSLIYMRQTPPGVTPLNSLAAFSGLESECDWNIEHGMAPECARSLGDMYMRVGDLNRARRWVGVYLNVNSTDPQAQAMWRQLSAVR